MSQADGGGKRFNKGKLRYDLIPSNSLKEIAKVFTYGCEKYGEKNWQRGMKWSNVIASLERHLAAFKQCEDFDEETGHYHIAHLATNAIFLLEYYRIYPQGDDREHSYYRSPKRIGLDIDDVLADFVPAFCDYNGITELPHHWSFYLNGDKYSISSLPDTFWLNIKPKIDPKSIKFEPVCYITHRPISNEITKKWLEINGFPCAPIYQVNPELSKVDIAKEQKLDVFVDDKYETFTDMNSSGILCWLFDASHNKKYNVGYKRIKSLENII
jgi:Domain of unknown function (DUF5664)